MKNQSTVNNERFGSLKILACSSWLSRSFGLRETHFFAFLNYSELCEPVMKTSRSITGSPVGMFVRSSIGQWRAVSMHYIIRPSPGLSGPSAVSAQKYSLCDDKVITKVQNRLIHFTKYLLSSILEIF